MNYSVRSYGDDRRAKLGQVDPIEQDEHTEEHADTVCD